MKKLFFSSSTSSDLQNSFVGKSYRVGRYSCTVEDVIAEGKHVLTRPYLMKPPILNTLILVNSQTKLITWIYSKNNEKSRRQKFLWWTRPKNLQTNIFQVKFFVVLIEMELFYKPLYLGF